MRRKFSLPIKGISINSLHYNDKRHGMRPEAKEWVDTVTFLLRQTKNAQAMTELREAFDASKHAYAIQIKAHVPRHIYYTKEGKLSRRSFDITNTEKPLVDVLFLEKYKVGLLIDDCVLKSCHSVKVPSTDDTWKIEIQIKIVKN
jgi:hypothetical protein